MDQRREPRFIADQSVVVTVLGDPEVQQIARIRNASGRGLSMEIPSKVQPGSALKIELDDSILLGEVIYCKGGQGSYLLGMELDQALCGLTELGKQLQEFATEELSGMELAYRPDNVKLQSVSPEMPD
jgi:hypothetical protein